MDAQTTNVFRQVRTRAEAQAKADEMNAKAAKTFLKDRISHAQLRSF